MNAHPHSRDELPFSSSVAEGIAGSKAWSTPPLLLSIKEAAASLSISRAHLYRLLETGELRAVRSRRAVRVPYVELQRYVARLMEDEGDSMGENRSVDR